MKDDPDVFLGEHQHTLDDKGRVILPARFRDRLAGGVVLTVSRVGCVDVVPRAEFERRVELLSEQVDAGEAPMSDLIILSARGFEEVPDGQGRVTIPPPLREYAGLERNLTVNGAVKAIQIWDRDRWDEFQARASQRFSQSEDGA